MKKNLILAAMLTLSAISCSKPHDAPPENKGYMRGKVDGVFFSDLTRAGISVPTSPMWGPLETDIEGQYGNGIITLKLPPFVTPGERLLNQSSSDAIQITTYTGGFFYAGFNGTTGSPIQGSGKINILEITNGFMKGTFECIAPVDSTKGTIRPPLSITEGEFNLKY
jgi:hypothetical protein